MPNRSRITRSARFPGDKVPLSRSSKYWKAAFTVTASRAVRASTRSSGPRQRPDRVSRFTAHQTVSRRSGGITGASVWKVKGIPAGPPNRRG